MRAWLNLAAIVVAFAYVGFACSLLIAADIGWNMIPMGLLMVFGVAKLHELSIGRSAPR